ncbi:fluoride efflux transporter FluC [Candidatus Planktophila versatilis]|nr:CrcB family protein [Candidatus Planktophila versatilis]
MKAVWLVSLGGVLGSLTRWILSLIIPHSGNGTLAANLLAVALAIFFLVLMERRGITELRYFLLPGFCGGLSTFSAVTYEAVAPDEAGFSYLLINVVASLIVAYLSLKVARKVVKARI